MAAARNMNSALFDKLDELLRLGPRSNDAVLGGRLVDVRGKYRRRLNQFVDCESRLLS